LLVRSAAVLALATALSAPAAIVQARQTTCEWDPTIGQSGIEAVPHITIAPSVHALAVFDDGRGPALYVGGYFRDAGGVPANCVARWDGRQWSALGAGLTYASGNPADVRALCVFDDGTGPALYAGGTFTRSGNTTVGRIAKWDGSAWTSVFSGIGDDGPWAINALRVHNDGSGSKLYAAGTFPTIFHMPAAGFARWNGSSWSTIGPNPGGEFFTMIDFGGDLYLGGNFSAAVPGECDAHNVARWDGLSWHNVSNPIDCDQPSGWVRSLAVFNDGSGPALFAGGEFSSIEKYTNGHWVSAASGYNTTAILTFDVGLGPRLCIADRLVFSNNSSYLRQWTGQSYQTFDKGVDFSVQAACMADLGKGPVLIVAGDFLRAGNVLARRIAAWDGAQWSPLGQGIGADPGAGLVSSMETLDDGRGPELFASGTFTAMDGALANHVARWDGKQWSNVGGGFTGPSGNSRVFAIKAFDDGTGPQLYASGTFFSAGDVPANAIARWNGAAWSQVGDGFASGAALAMQVFDDGAGPALYVGGGFRMADGAVGPNIARWRSGAWSGMGGSFDILNSRVNALAVFKESPQSAPVLIAGGKFTTGTGPGIGNIARWDGSAWSSLLNGANGEVRGLAVYNDGAGDALYVWGDFTTVNGISSPQIARWTGTAWQAVHWTNNDSIAALHAFNDDDGPALAVAGTFTSIGGIPANRIAVLRQGVWSAFDAGLGNPSSCNQATCGYPGAFSLHFVPSGPTAGLYVGGSFRMAGANESNGIARWACLTRIAGDVNGSGHVDIDDLVMVITSWGQCRAPCSNSCAADVNRDCTVNIDDLMLVLTHWG
jgi:hypothetical protein